MVGALAGILIVFLLGTGQPFSWECPESVQTGQSFSLSITCSEPGCSGISAGRVPSSAGLVHQGSSSSTSVSTVVTQNSRQLTQSVVLNIIFQATGEGAQTIGPVDLDIYGIGSFTVDEIAVSVTGNGSTPGTQGTTASSQPVQNEDQIWLEGILRDPGGHIFPGTRLFIDYYIYARVGIENISYWWEAPELGVIRHVETNENSNWEYTSKRDNSSRSLLAEVEMAPAAAGSLQAPIFQANVTGTDYNPWGKASEWTVENTPVILPVYPFPDNPPQHWDGSLLDSVSVRIEQLSSPPGQGGELSVRLTCLGPGNIYMDQPPAMTIHGNANLISADNGASYNKKWWDFVFEPLETGDCVLGPDTLVWLDRRNSTYRAAVIQPCSLSVAVIPRTDREIVLCPEKDGIPAIFWVFIGITGVLALTILSAVAARRRDRRLASVTSAGDLDELLSGLEGELSRMLTGRKEYMGYEELSEFLNKCDTDSFLARRILRFWRDLEQSISDREITGPAFEKLKSTADELLLKLRNDLNSNDINNEKE